MDYRFEEQSDIKLMALFIINAFGIPVSNAMIVDVALCHPFVDYFAFAAALSDLAKNGLVSRTEENQMSLYTLTVKGREALDYFASRLPFTVRERLRLSVKGKIREMRQALSVIARCERVNEVEYIAHIGLSEAGNSLFSLKFSVGDEHIAREICENFKRSPQQVYSELLGVLIKDKS